MVSFIHTSANEKVEKNTFGTHLNDAMYASASNTSNTSISTNQEAIPFSLYFSSTLTNGFTSSPPVEDLSIILGRPKESISNVVRTSKKSCCSNRIPVRR